MSHYRAVASIHHAGDACNCTRNRLGDSCGWRPAVVVDDMTLKSLEGVPTYPSRAHGCVHGAGSEGCGSTDYQVSETRPESPWPRPPRANAVVASGWEDTGTAGPFVAGATARVTCGNDALGWGMYRNLWQSEGENGAGEWTSTDPERMLARMLTLANKITATCKQGAPTLRDLEAEATELADLVRSMDVWLSRGGALPDRWDR